MSLIIDLDRSTERKLKSVASQSGTSTQSLALDILKGHLDKFNGSKPLNELSIPELYDEINRDMPEKEWKRYKWLNSKRRNETITRKELAELRRAVSRREVMHAHRLSFVAELARRRGTDLFAEMERLGIKPKHV